MHWVLSVNLYVCLVSAITFVKLYREWHGGWDWDSEAVLKQALIKPIEESIVQFCRLNLRMCEGVDSKPAGSYNELATCHAQRFILGDGDSGFILEACVRPSVQMERGGAQNGFRFKNVSWQLNLLGARKMTVTSRMSLLISQVVVERPVILLLPHSLCL